MRWKLIIGWRNEEPENHLVRRFDGICTILESFRFYNTPFPQHRLEHHKLLMAGTKVIQYLRLHTDTLVGFSRKGVRQAQGYGMYEEAVLAERCSWQSLFSQHLITANLYPRALHSIYNQRKPKQFETCRDY